MSQQHDERIMVRSAGLRDAVDRERQRLKRELGLELTLSQTAASLIRQGLRRAEVAGGDHARV